ncbi:MAG: hypothetical protein LBC85_07570 [Fibromonadaceae bacterium]|jgi:uncharacterized protein (TIGR02145 family)|nr:hypothetical protein [Fibromonadaceae bacterium]
MRNRLLALVCAAFLFSCERGDIEVADLIACGEFDASTHFCDRRDGELYKFVRIGNQTWMAENLRYEHQTSRCPDNKQECNDIYGRLYLNNGKLNEYCPKGWKIPGPEDWEELEEREDYNYTLKAGYDWLEYEGQVGNGDDNYGFSALPAGAYMVGYAKWGKEYCEVLYEDNKFFEWGASKEESEISLNRSFGHVAAFISSDGRPFQITSNLDFIACFAENSSISVRCIKD